MLRGAIAEAVADPPRDHSLPKRMLQQVLLNADQSSGTRKWPATRDPVVIFELTIGSAFVCHWGQAEFGKVSVCVTGHVIAPRCVQPVRCM